MDKYQRVKVLGTGSFGTAMLVRACDCAAPQGGVRAATMACGRGGGERGGAMMKGCVYRWRAQVRHVQTRQELVVKQIDCSKMSRAERQAAEQEAKASAC
jgi:hypothetical protein